MLLTARVKVETKNGMIFTCRTLLDTCSTASFITENLAKKLQVSKQTCSLTIQAMNDLTTTANYYTQLTFKSMHSDFKKSLTFFIIPQITDFIPNEAIPRNELNIPSHIKLADPEFDKPAAIDMLIAAGPTLSMFCPGQINLRKNDDLILQKTRLGWIIGGGLNLVDQSFQSNCLFSKIEANCKESWDIDTFPVKNSTWSKDEISCENHFKAHVNRTSDGRYVFALPFRNHKINLGESRQVALKRLLFLYKRFDKNPEFKSQYTKIFEEYINLGHMTPIVNSNTHGFYLPHHAVIKDTSNTTKLRIVFDASAKSSNGKSINDNLYVGATIQDDLFSILIRFRTFIYVIIADIEKMYRQFLIRESDRVFQKVLWKINDKITEFQLNTVTFGFSCAPYLAIRGLFQLADDEEHKYPLAANILKQDMYVDNMLTGTNSEQEAREICHQMISILNSAGMKMRQWASNYPSILHGISPQDLDSDFYIDKNSSIKTLGMFWKANEDIFSYKIQSINTTGSITKRKILSEIAKIFDPIGLLGPIILHAKKLMQNIWQAKIHWDETVPHDIHYAWINFCDQLNVVKNVTFDRKVIFSQSDDIELHGFCDASQIGYGACLYIRSKDPKNNYNISLLCSKSRVAPLKTRTIPRMELCAMVLLANLFVQVTSAINIDFRKIVFWSDSTIALHWINTSKDLLKTFVSNRVKEIQNKTNVKNWRHVRSHDNPADALSRGQLPHDFVNNIQWRFGPDWLKNDEQHWPETHIIGLTDVPETKSVQCLITLPDSNYLIQKINSFSSYTRLIRTFARCFRFVPKYKRFDSLDVTELQRAESAIIKIIQQAHFSDEIRMIQAKKPLKENSQILSLDPFIDNHGLLRVGGRTRKAMISFSKRHPIILPSNNHLTNLIITSYHWHNYHTGIQNTLYAMREKFWPVHGRGQIRRELRKCTVCFQAKPKPVSYKMGDLPSYRVNNCRPFNNVGVDYCGPFYIKEKNYRNKGFIKTYAAIFVCMTVKAVHIEIAEDLSTESFLGALARFVGRRGKPEHIFSDNGSNFRGANSELQELTDLLKSQSVRDSLDSFVTKNNIEWHFIPPHSPNFGGLWEATVKQFKYHFKRVASNKRFTYSQFNTFAIEVEAILNSRPLTPINNDVNDYTALTPGHFLIGDSLIGLPEHNYSTLPENRLNAWQNIKKIKQDFWKRWHKEYLSELNVRTKHSQNKPTLKIGMLVLLQNDDTNYKVEWTLGRIKEMHPGTDKIIRTVTVATKDGLKKRPTSKIAILPTIDNVCNDNKMDETN